MKKLSVGSLFAGIGGFDLGLERTGGFEVKWQVEIDPFCRAVLAKHWPEVKRYEDVREVCTGTLRVSRDDSRCAECGRRDYVPPIDVLVGGFPCQPVSSAGKKLAQLDERWLWPEFFRLVRELRPRYALVENVPGLFDRGFSDVLGDLASVGFDAEWSIVSACALGAPHPRERVFILAYPARNNESDSRIGAHQDQRFQERRAESRGDGGGPRGTRWLPEPAVDRVAHGLPRWMVQPPLGGLGNAVVPDAIEWLGRQILSFEETRLIA